MRYKMILGETLFSFFKKEKQGLRIKEVRFMNRDMNGEVNGSTRLLYDEDSGRVQRYVNGSAPIASLPDDMVCFLAEVSRCLGRLTGDMSWEKDVWLCVDSEVKPEHTGVEVAGASIQEMDMDEYGSGQPFPGSATGEQFGEYRGGQGQLPA